MRKLILIFFWAFIVYPGILVGQIKSFKQLASLIANDVPTMKQLLKFEGYSYENTGEIFPKVNCQMWSNFSNEGNKTVFGFARIMDKYPMYLFIDTTYTFLQNTLLDIDLMGYRHPDKNSPELYTNGEDFLVIEKASYGFCYLFGKHYENWMNAMRVVSAANNSKNKKDKK
jgi:hypothetical protein